MKDRCLSVSLLEQRVQWKLKAEKQIFRSNEKSVRRSSNNAIGIIYQAIILMRKMKRIDQDIFLSSRSTNTCNLNI